MDKDLVIKLSMSLSGGGQRGNLRNGHGNVSCGFLERRRCTSPRARRYETIHLPPSYELD